MLRRGLRSSARRTTMYCLAVSLGPSLPDGEILCRKDESDNRIFHTGTAFRRKTRSPQRARRRQYVNSTARSASEKRRSISPKGEAGNQRLWLAQNTACSLFETSIFR